MGNERARDRPRRAREREREIPKEKRKERDGQREIRQRGTDSGRATEREGCSEFVI